MLLTYLLESYGDRSSPLGDNVNPHLSDAELRDYANLLRAVASYSHIAQAQWEFSSTAYWVLGGREIGTATSFFDLKLARWFYDIGGRVSAVAAAEVIRFSCRRYLKIKWAVRGTFLAGLIAGGGALFSSGGLVKLYELALGLSVAGFFATTWAKCSFVKALDSGSAWSTSDSRFLEVLRVHGDGLLLGSYLQEELGAVKSGLGLSANGYELLNSLAPGWELSFNDLLGAVHSLSI